MNWSSNILAFLEVLSILTLDATWHLFDRIFMASRFETHAKGWQNFPNPIGRLEAIERYTGYGNEKIKTTTDDDECIYYPLVYGHEDKLKIVVNPTHRLYNKSQSKINTQSPLVKGSKKDKKNIGYGTGEDGCYEILRSTVAQSSPPLKHHLASVDRDMHAPVSRSTLRALSNDFEQNKDRVMTFEPTTGGCRQSFRHTNLSQNNNYVYERPNKANDAGERRFVSPHFDDGFIEREDNEELLDYCTCMCCVKGAFYHFTKDSDNEGHIADQPCSCSGPLSQCLPRWGCLGILTLFLPCLCCYLPVKGCKKIGKTQRRSINSPPGVQSTK